MSEVAQPAGDAEAEAPHEVPPGDDASARQGDEWRGDDREELKAVIEEAFDYRGNITLHLRDGVELAGYLFNREIDGDASYVELFGVDEAHHRIDYAQIQAVAFSGRDTAAGKSWETWVKKYNAKKEAEARGENVGSIDLFPDELD